MTTTHLSDDQLDEVMMGISGAEASAHLAECSQCGERFAAFQSQVDVFNHATMAWSEARSNTFSRDIATRKFAPRLALRAAWTSATVATLALGFAIGSHYPASPATMANVHAPMVMPAPEVVHEHEIDSDNEMLAAIHSEIVTPDADRVELYESTKEPAPASHPNPEQARD